MEWNKATDTFKPTRPAPLPEVMINMKLDKHSHQKYGSSIPPNNRWQQVFAVADTGCQTCTAGMNLVNKLNCNESTLINTRHKIIGITDANLDIRKALMVDISHHNKTTKQMIHISSNTTGLYLSETALKELNLIDKEFPHHITRNCAGATTKTKDTCTCPKRTSPPKPPTCLPFQPLPENIQKLRTWLLKAFASSAFNICPHQPLHTRKI